MNEFVPWIEVLLRAFHIAILVVGAIALLRIIHRLLLNVALEDNAIDGLPTIVEQIAMAELEKAKHEDSDDGGYPLTDEEARSMGLAPDWREQIQMMREDESRE